ncbi:3'-5' RNA helicase YTHDC2-like [Ptychodera flava]|uniref:3'-5' RNA helicase YTHDC2-like n=1 Tax=Ptychodera flava TaxID=63121 RepID=UPI00396A8E4F
MATRGKEDRSSSSVPPSSRNSPPITQFNRPLGMSSARNVMPMNMSRPSSASPRPPSVSSVGSSGSYKKKGGKTKAEICVGEELKIAIKIALDEFRYSDDKKELEFPSSLTATERAYIHRLCAGLGLATKSKGKGSNRYLTISKNDGNKQASSVATFQLTRNSRHQVHSLLQRYPVTNKERQELQPRSERGYYSSNDSGQREMNKTTGRLNSGVPQISPRQMNTEFDHFRQSLPIHQSKDLIVKTINENRVVLISGDTGSGKTTQVPQFLLNDSANTGRPVRIVCTQPRRISALAMAERVATERGEKVGQTVGYQIRLESRVSPKTLLTFCTNGVLLRTLMGGGTSLNPVTHVIVDEIHERDKYSDFLMIQMRDMLSHNKNLKIVLMSAALDVQLFVRYFSGCPVIEIPGAMFEVKQLFLEDVLKCTGYMNKGMEKYKRELVKLEQQQSQLNEWYKQQESKAADIQELHADKTPEQEDEGVIMDREEDMSKVEKELDSSELEPWLLKEMDNCITDAWLKGSEDSFSQLFHLIHSENVSVDYSHTETGATALMVAAGRGNSDVVEKLLNLGANVNVRSSNDWTALDWAKKFNRSDIVELIEAHIAASELSCSDETQLVSESKDISKEDKELLSIYHHSFDDERVDLKLVVSLLNYICSFSEEGAVLVFLPGYDEIVTLRDKLLCDEKRFANNSKYVLYTMHSNMQTQDQKRVFRTPPRGCRKIILSTNIAETSVTINDIVFVIDAGKVKEKSFDALTGVSMLKNNWISKASSKQRMGRAGRCRPGICFHLFSRARYQSLMQFQSPELLRVPLQELCLHTKLLAPMNTPIADFLTKAPEPPAFLTVRNAVQLLKSIDAIDNWEYLTEIGHHLVDLPVEPRLGKMVLYSVVLKCLDPILTIVCALAYRDPFVLPNRPSEKRAALMVRKKFAAGTNSDHMALLRAFQAWQRARSDSWERTFCEKNYISQATMEMVVGMRTQLLGQLRASGFVRARGGGDIRDLNSNSENWAVVKAALCAGMYPNLIRVDRERVQLMTQKESKVRFHPSSVLSQPPTGKMTVADAHAQNVKNLPTDWLIYDEMTRTHRIANTRCVTVVSPVTVALFAGPARLPSDSLTLPDVAYHEPATDGQEDTSSSEGEGEDDGKKANMRVDEWISFKIDAEAATYTLQLRQKWHSLFLRRMRAPSKPWSQVDESVIRAVIGVLTNEEQALGLQQPAGIGQRPRPMSSEPMSSPNYRKTPNENDFSEIDDSESGRKPWMKSPKRTNITPPKDRRRDFRSPRPHEDKLSSFTKSPSDSSTTASPSDSPSPPGSVKGIDKSSPSSEQVLSHRYFIVKCNNQMNLEISLTKGIWSTSVGCEKRLSKAYEESTNVYLIFSVQGSGHFQGYARMSSGISKERSHELGTGSSASLGGLFSVEWIKRANVSFQQTKDLCNPWNDNKKVKIARDGQELEPQVGEKLLQHWSKVEDYKPGSGDATHRVSAQTSPSNPNQGPRGNDSGRSGGGSGKGHDKRRSPQYGGTPPMTPQYHKGSPLLGNMPGYAGPAHGQVYPSPTGSPIPLAHSSPSSYPGMVFPPRGSPQFAGGNASPLSASSRSPRTPPSNMFTKYGSRGSPSQRGSYHGKDSGQNRYKGSDKTEDKK